MSFESACVPLSEQDTARWACPLLAEAHQLLLSAEQSKRIGCFQLEAAIQSAHARRALTRQTDWEDIALLYDGLVRLAPTVDAMDGRPVAVAEARGAAIGWTFLEAPPRRNLSRPYQSYWALADHFHANLGHQAEPRSAHDRSIGLCGIPDRARIPRAQGPTNLVLSHNSTEFRRRKKTDIEISILITIGKFQNPTPLSRNRRERGGIPTEHRCVSYPFLISDDPKPGSRAELLAP